MPKKPETDERDDYRGADAPEPFAWPEKAKQPTAPPTWTARPGGATTAAAYVAKKVQPPGAGLAGIPGGVPTDEE